MTETRPSPDEAGTGFAGAEFYDLAGPDDPLLASEHAVLGRIIGSAPAALEAAAVLEGKHFSRNASRVVFEAVIRLADNGQPVEPASVLAELARDGLLAKAGAEGMGTGGVFLASLMERAGDVGYHAPRIIAGWFRRNLIAELDACRALAGRPDFDPAEGADAIRKRVEDATALTAAGDLHPNSETVDAVLDAIERREDPGIPTGYRDLDDAIGGLRPGELIVAGGRPGQGKTLLGLCIADHVGTRLKMPVLFASLEMTEDELTRRRIAATAKVPLVQLVRHQVADGTWERIRHAYSRLTETELRIDDTPRASMAHLRGRLRSMIRGGSPARLLVIDYLGFLAAPKAESRQQAVAELARQAKGVAREFAIPVILLAQLNRGPEHRQDKRPMSADLRESGEIEQSADIVALIHNEGAAEPESKRAGEVDLLITKNRQGPLCTITLCFQGHYGRIACMAPREWSPSAAADGA